MISMAECSASTGLAPNESFLGVSPSDKHERTLSSYLLNSHRGAAIVRDIIIADIRGFIDLGLPHVAADLTVVLRLFLSKCPEARHITRPPVAWDGTAATSTEAKARSWARAKAPRRRPDGQPR